MTLFCRSFSLLPLCSCCVWLSLSLSARVVCCSSLLFLRFCFVQTLHGVDIVHSFLFMTPTTLKFFAIFCQAFRPSACIVDNGASSLSHSRFVSLFCSLSLVSCLLHWTPSTHIRCLLRAPSHSLFLTEPGRTHGEYRLHQLPIINMPKGCVG